MQYHSRIEFVFLTIPLGGSMSFQDIKTFSLWLLIIINLTYYSTFYTFNGLAL